MKNTVIATDNFRSDLEKIINDPNITVIGLIWETSDGVGVSTADFEGAEQLSKLIWAFLNTLHNQQKE